MDTTLQSGNYVRFSFYLSCNIAQNDFVIRCFFQFFTATFAVEAVMKLMAMSPKFYFKESGTFSENSNLFWFAFTGGLEHL